LKWAFESGWTVNEFQPAANTRNLVAIIHDATKT